jgi:hypothetical protein
LSYRTPIQVCLQDFASNAGHSTDVSFWQYRTMSKNYFRFSNFFVRDLWMIGSSLGSVFLRQSRKGEPSSL